MENCLAAASFATEIDAQRRFGTSAIHTTFVTFTVASVAHFSQNDSLFLTIYAHQELEKHNYSLNY